jgi:mannitol-1-phosphate/altronate dehydrogenase
MSELIAESSAVYCTCNGAIFGDPEQMCERCLDAYADAVIQRLKGSDLKRELERIARIVVERLQKEPDLADAVKANLQAEAALAAQRRPLN